MEHVRGRDLDRWRAEAARGWRQILGVFLQCGEGLLAAHRVGLVHRDFKPSNAIIDREGRARVLDFGLARREDADSTWPFGPVVRVSCEAPEVSLTGAGGVVGTPAYMAPEQHEGRDADARSDQFSFCAALFEALYAARPFVGDDRRAIYEAIVAGEVTAAPAGSDVPLWLRAAVVRGLARDPAERWPSFAELLAALRPAPARTSAGRHRWPLAVAAGLALAGLAVALGLAWGHASTAVDDCASGREQLRGSWDAPREAAVAAAFAGLDTPYARQAAPLLVARLDGYADAWATMYEEACEARRRGEHSEQLLDRRMICLRHRRTELGALVDRLAVADETLARGALRAVASLPDIGGCADLVALAAQPAKPEEPAVAARVDGLRDELARAMADELAGRYDEALARASAVVDASRELGYQPLEAEARLRVAFVQERTAAYEEAMTSLLAAYLAAEESQHMLVQSEAASLLSFVVGVRLAEVDEGEMWAGRAERLIDRLGEGGEAHAQLLANRGALDMQRGALEEAVADYRRALVLFAESRGPDDPKLVAPRLALGAALGRLGRLDEAKAEFEATLAQVEASFGDLHPSVAALLNNLGTVTFARGEFEQAAAHWERALAVYERTIGLEHPEAAASLNNLGSARTLLGDYAEARRQLERALASRRASLGGDHPLVAAVINNLAVVDEHEGEHAEAKEKYARALAILEASHGPGHPSLRSPLVGLGAAAVELGDYAAALEHLERADKLAGPAAIAEDRARAKIALARALWGVGAERERARATMRAALEEVADARGREGEALREEATRWLVERGAGGAGGA